MNSAINVLNSLTLKSVCCSCLGNMKECGQKYSFYITIPRVLFWITTWHWFRYGNKAADDGPFSHFQCSQKWTSSNLCKLLISERKIQQVIREKKIAKFVKFAIAASAQTHSSINYLHKTHQNIWCYLKTCHYVTAISGHPRKTGVVSEWKLVQSWRSPTPPPPPTLTLMRL